MEEDLQWRMVGGRRDAFSALGPENDVFFFQTLALLSELLGRGCWLRAHGIGVGCLPGVFVVGQCHSGAVISLLMWLKKSYKSNEDACSP